MSVKIIFREGLLVRGGTRVTVKYSATCVEGTNTYLLVSHSTKLRAKETCSHGKIKFEL